MDISIGVHLSGESHRFFWVLDMSCCHEVMVLSLFFYLATLKGHYFTTAEEMHNNCVEVNCFVFQCWQEDQYFFLVCVLICVFLNCTDAPDEENFVLEMHWAVLFMNWITEYVSGFVF